MQWTVAPGEGVAGRVRALAPDGVDAVMDCVGQGVLHATADVGSSRLRACSIADGGPGIATVFARMDSAILSQLVEMVDAGRLRVPIVATYPLAQATAAQAALQQPHPRPARPRGLTGGRGALSGADRAAPDESSQSRFRITPLQYENARKQFVSIHITPSQEALSASLIEGFASMHRPAIVEAPHLAGLQPATHNEARI